MKDPELYSVHKVWIACYRHRYGSGILEDNFVATFDIKQKAISWILILVFGL